MVPGAKHTLFLYPNSPGSQCLPRMQALWWTSQGIWGNGNPRINMVWLSGISFSLKNWRGMEESYFCTLAGKQWRGGKSHLHQEVLKDIWGLEDTTLGNSTTPWVGVYAFLLQTHMYSVCSLGWDALTPQLL